MPANEIDIVPEEIRDLAAALHQLPGGVDDGAIQIGPRIPGAGRRSAAAAGLRSGRTRLRFLRQDLFEIRVVDDGQFEAARPELSGVLARRQHRAELRGVRGLGDARLAWKVRRELILTTGVLDPFLRERGAREDEDKCRDDDSIHRRSVPFRRTSVNGRARGFGPRDPYFPDDRAHPRALRARDEAL